MKGDTRKGLCTSRVPGRKPAEKIQVIKEDKRTEATK